MQLNEDGEVLDVSASAGYTNPFDAGLSLNSQMILERQRAKDDTSSALDPIELIGEKVKREMERAPTS